MNTVLLYSVFNTDDSFLLLLVELKNKVSMETGNRQCGQVSKPTSRHLQGLLMNVFFFSLKFILFILFGCFLVCFWLCGVSWQPENTPESYCCLAKTCYSGKRYHDKKLVFLDFTLQKQAGFALPNLTIDLLIIYCRMVTRVQLAPNIKVFFFFLQQ